MQYIKAIKISNLFLGGIFNPWTTGHHKFVAALVHNTSTD